MVKNNKLDKNNVENFMALTSLQQGMLFHYISDEESNMYHEQLSLTLRGDLKLELLKKAWQFVIESNEILRTIFRWKGIEKPIQVVLKQHEIPIKYLDFTNKENKEVLVKEVKVKDLASRIDITRETLRIYLCKLDESIHEMIISNHHILYDGWSNGIILKEVMEAYNCLYEGKEPKKLNKTRFSQFIKYLNTINKEDEKKYWSTYLEGLEDKNDYFSCKEVGVYKEILYKIDNLKANKIKNFSKENKVLLSSILYGAWGVLLQKFNNSKEVLFGTTVSGRPENISSIDKMVGLFINTIPLRIKSDEKTTLMGLINSIDKSLNERIGFENTSLIDIKEYCGLKANEELFNSIVTIENYPLDFSANNENVLFIDEFSIVEQTNYNMALEILTFDGIEFKFSFNSLSIAVSLVEKLGVYLERIIENLLNNPNISLENIDLLSEQEKNQILYEFNNTKVDYPKNKTIHELFEEQVEKTPDNIAVVFEDEKLTYRELNERANSLAIVLRDKGVKADSIVAIMVESSLEMAVGIIGILKAGGAYLPIDPNYPNERIEYMLKDSESKTVLSQSSFIGNIEFNGQFIDLDDESLFNKETSNLEKINNSSNLAYIIYTSGTTGKPKGVMIEHRSIAMTLLWRKEQYKLGRSDSVLQLFSSAFDGFVTSFYTPIISGAKVVLLNKNEVKDVFSIKEKIALHKITHFISVPSMCLAIMDCLTDLEANSLRIITLAGENLTSKVVEKCKSLKENIEIVNEYGPTENSVVTTIMRDIDTEKGITIGKPKDNTKIYIVNSNNKLQSIGVPGEICISGEGLARGYLNRKELTAEKFVDNPFEQGTRMYKTGDLARWLSDGNIEFLGRLDNQVKIRGFRIELGEIETRLLQHESIKEAAVLVKEHKDGEKYICAYVVSDKSIEESNLRSCLKEKLPEYMIPTYFVELEKMPLTTNGKLDRRSLPEPSLDATLTEYEAPRNKVEEILVKIWSEILGVKKVGINDNFFDLGGHSLKATMLMSKIHKELNREVPLKELFKSPTIKELGKFIESAEENLYSKIEKIEEKEYYETSSAQKRMYMLQQFDKDSTAYNMPGVFEIEGKVDKNRIEETFIKLTERHEALRTYFEILNGEVIQKLQKKYVFGLKHINENENIEDIVNKFVRPFDLGKAPLFRVELVENNEKTYLLMDMHHIISDGVSMSILIHEFTEVYSGKALEPLKLQYKDFAAWQNNFLKSEKMKKQEEYWINSFSDEIPVLNMPTDYERPAMQSFEGDKVSFELNEDVTLKLKKLTKETGTTMHMALLSAFNILLSKYSGQEDIVIGTPIAGRPHADLQNIMGMFVNTLALRNKPQGDKKYVDFLKEVKENSLKAYENQSYQLEALVEKLDVRRDASRNPLFDVMFNMVDTVTGESIRLDDIVLKLYNNQSKISKFDITLNALEMDEKLSFTIDYCSKLFKKETIERLSSHYLRILDNIANDREIILCEVDLLSEAEKNQILYEFNDTKVDYQKDKTIQELFESQVEKTPDNMAIVFEDKKLTYRELNERANSLAGVLRDKGVKADSIVGIMAERSLEMIVGIMGILKAGGAYIPIDTSYPKDRIEYILEDSGSKILLSEESLMENISFDGEVIDIYNEEVYKGESHNVSSINNSNDLAYVIYTSGTTGKPKGVMINHYNLVNYCCSIIKKLSLTENDETALLSSYAFDLGYTAVFTSLVVGGKLNLITEEKFKNPQKLAQFLMNDITYIKITPSIFNMIINSGHIKKLLDNSRLRLIIIGGESINVNDLEKFISIGNKKNIKIVNHYGPTETTVGCIATFIDLNNLNYIRNIIGTPLNNVKAFILDKNSKLCGVNIPGELCISGEGLSRGYLNRPELTAEKFVENPFEPGKKMYRTGDLARWLPDGSIEFLGRIDNQVKIRGFRIELGEIENRLLKHESIKEAAVLVKENKASEKYICAYVVSDKKLQELDLKGHLKETLPEYMVPAYFIELEKIPLTMNGKLDRRALPEPNLDVNLTEYEGPRNTVEETLAKIWSEVLGIEKVGINDNFFDLGGHSLKATMLMSKIHKELSKEVPLKELFKSPTIKELSKYIEYAEDSLYSKIEKLEEKEYYEASSAQKRMYMLQQFDRDSIAYNMPVIFELEGKADKNKIAEAFKNLIERHEALRTYFEIFNGQIIQKLQKTYGFQLQVNEGNMNIKDIIKDFVRPFNLEKAPLFRTEFVNNKEKAYLLIDMHHIISDGVSMSILIKEFTELYSGKDLEPLKLQYKDFAAWQNNFLKSEDIKKQEDYWINRFSDEIPVLNMPADYERPAIQSFDGASVSFEVSEDTTLKLRRLTKETGTTMHMALLSAFNILLSKYSGQEDIVIGTPTAGRPHADLQNIMGMFVNTLALRNNPQGDKKYIDFLKEVKENSLKAYENESYQLESLVEKLDIRRDTSRNPLFDVMFNKMDTVNGRHIELNDIILKQYNSVSKISKFDLTLNAVEIDTRLNFNIEYCSKIFKKETIERLSNHYVKILDTIASNVEIKLCEIDLLSEEERNQILYDFNDTNKDYPKDKTIHELFESQVKKTPNNIAIVFEGNMLTYRELNERANNLAKVLRHKGVKTDSIVGIMVERSLEMIVGIMGILKAGGAYLPIDPSYPKERIEYMLKDSESKILLSLENLIENIEFKGEIIDLFDKDLFQNALDNLDKFNGSNNLAYIIYTSGTTGNPKGTMIEHKSLVNLCDYHNKNFNITEKDRSTTYASFSFDACVWEIWPYLITGASIYILADNIRLNMEKLNEYYEENNITISFLPTQIFERFIQIKNSSLRIMLTGGDKLNYYNENGFKIVNNYGPTETTVVATSYLINNTSSNIPIGKPINNTKVYILKNNKLMPIGVAGELCIAGDGLARGYLNKPELTSEKFIDNPFEPGTKMYKTGDLARWLPDGNIEFLGRIDNQVKIRGFRIELGEIENRLLQHESVKETAVLVKETKENEKYICAYVVSDKKLQELNLKGYLKEKLPEYMVPAYFAELEKMPLTANGKLDRRALPEPNLDVNSAEYEGPRNEVEETLAKIWSEVLGVEKVSINDNFFDLGGHSLKATILISKIHKELKKEVTLKDLFKSPTIKDLSKYIENAEENLYSKIDKVEEKEYYEASSAQKRMYMLQQFDKCSTAYNMPVVFELDGKVDKNKIEETFRKLTERHEALRTYFETLDGEIIQKLQNHYEFKLEHRNEYGYIENIISDFVRPFDLEKLPLFRVELVENKEKTYLLIDMHHIISDGVSMDILIKEFIELYSGKTLEPLKIQYKDFAAWQNNFLKSEEMKSQEGYWINRFSDGIPVLNMPLDFPRPSIQSFEGNSIKIKLNKDITRHLRKISNHTGATMYMVLLAGINILISKYSGQEDIVILTPIADRMNSDLENIIGLFVNTLPIRNYLDVNKTYKEFLFEVKENVLTAFENKELPFEILMDKLNINRDTNANSLFDVMFNMYSTKHDAINLENLVLKEYKRKEKIAKFPLNFSANEAGDEIFINIEYSTKLFKRSTIERMGKHLINVFGAITKSCNTHLYEIELITDEERNLIKEYNSTNVKLGKNMLLYEAFERQVERTPENIAIAFNNIEISYRELNKKSNQLSRRLIELGAARNQLIGLMVDRSIDMIVGILAIIKSGAAYLPIDPSYPKERIKYILENSNSNMIVTESKYSNLDYIGEITRVDVDNYSNYFYNSENISNINDPTDLIYTIYTSGSTGKPKGVVMTHEAVANTVYDINCKFGINEFDRIIGLSSVCFDLSVYDIFGALSTGAKLVQISDQRDVNEIIRVFNKHKITIWNSVPAIMDMLIENISNSFKDMNLRLVLMSGDWIPLKLPEKILEHFPKANSISLGGATEAAIWSIYYPITKVREEWSSIPYGMPLSNQKFYVLNKELQLCPFGVVGELYIGGIGVAKEYMNDKEKTSSSFINHEKLGRLYKTGDLGRFNEEGYIEFLGRRDYQIKIRGYRIELGEIENALMSNEYVKEALVTVKEDQSSAKYLCAYVSLKENFNINELKQYVSNKLPDYMVPSYFIMLDKIPLTKNGKVDKRLLPEPIINVVSEYILPRNEVEEKLEAIWVDVLKLSSTERIGIDVNFFSLGGHSLRATSLATKVKKEFNTEIPLKYIFKSPTIRKLAEYIEKNEAREYIQIEPIENKEFYELSSSQKRLYTLQKFDENEIAYNMLGIFEIEGKLDIERLKYAFNILVERHEVLRTSFELTESDIVQKVSDEVMFDIEYIITEKRSIDEIVKDFVKPFRLDKAPLMRVSIVKVEKDRHFLMYDMHHIISDGVSMGILVDEFTKLYEGKELKKLRIQYKDYASWQNKLLKSNEIKKQERYWLDIFNNEIPILELPTDYPRQSIQSFEGDNLYFNLDYKTTEGLRKIARDTDSTMFMVILASFNILLSKYSGQEDIVVGTPIAGRHHVDLDEIVGMFVNTLALRNNVDCNMSYKEFLQRVKTNALGAYENQDFQFEELIEIVKVKRDLSRNPLFDVMFVMQNTEFKEFHLEGLKIKEYEISNYKAKFDITMSAIETDSGIKMNIEYCSKLFKRKTIENMIRHLNNIFCKIIDNIDVRLCDIDILDLEERDKLLYEFNNTLVEYPQNKTLHQLFEDQVRKTPNNVAVIFENDNLTYSELNDRANQLARTLIKKGLEHNQLVAIMADKSMEILIGILAVLKTGAAYLPIDPEYPNDRIEYIINDSCASMLLTQSVYLEKISNYQNVLLLDDINLFDNDKSNLDIACVSKDLAYVIYTSGSSGNPKGVMVPHSGVVNYINWAIDKYLRNEKLNFPLYSSISFDLTVTSIYVPLLTGNSIIIFKDDEHEVIIEKVLRDNRIGIVKLTPSHLQLIQKKENKEAGVKKIIVGGEQLDSNLAKKIYEIFNNRIEIYNEYGPTEASVGCMIYKYDPKNNLQAAVPIGVPAYNTRIYLLDKNYNLVPQNVVGELYISGAGLSLGYINNKNLTYEKFINDPFYPGEKMYKTGDLARLLDDGNMEFLGRIDSQVKIRGFRIELGEIENILLKYTGINEAIVITKNDTNENKYICAYIVSDFDLNISKVKDYVSAHLPNYMIPSYFIQLDKIPLTPNGKSDKNALPDPRDFVLGCDYEAPTNEVEEKLVNIWAEVLGINNIGINHNFFELGGHSINAVFISSRIHKELNVEVPFKEIFRLATIKEIAKYIFSEIKSNYTMIPKVEEREYYPVSMNQKRIFIVNQFNTRDISYNMPIIYKIQGDIDLIKLENAFNKLIERHSVFKTFFKLVNGEPVQIINNEYNFRINIMEAFGRDIDCIINELIIPFDLSKSPLLRVNYIKDINNEKFLMIDMHHIISDGISLQILIKEAISLYKGNELKELSIQYKDFSVWQYNYQTKEYINNLKSYWEQKIKDLNYTQLPHKYVDIGRKAGGINKIIIFNNDEILKIDEFCKGSNVTKFTFFIAVLGIILMNELTQDDIGIGIPSIGRNHSQLQDIIGLFLNVVLIRINIDKNDTFETYLRKVNEILVEALEYQELPYDELYNMAVEKFGIKTDSLFTIMFNYMPYMARESDDGSIKLNETTLDLYNNKYISPKYDLSFYVNENKDNLVINMVYKDTIEEYIIDRIANAFSSISSMIIGDASIQLKNISYNETVYEDSFSNNYNNLFDNEDFFD